jgi:hypothetical protein
MNFYTSTSFRNSISKLTRKPKDGYESVVKDLCQALISMEDSILRDTNDRIRQEQNFRIVKLRVKNSHQNLPKNDAFRLIYWVSTKSDNLVLLTVYPKRGPWGISNLSNGELMRLLEEMLFEKENSILQKVDIANNLNVIDEACSW